MRGTRILIHEPTGVGRRNDLIVGGVPMARGDMPDGGWFELADERGRSFLVEGTPAAFWPDGSVKWLHLCGPADLAGGRTNAFHLRPASAPHATALRAETSPDSVHVRGGILDVDLRAAAGDCLGVRRTGQTGCALLRSPGLTATLALEGPGGADRRTLGWSSAAAAPEVVRQGPQRVVLRLGGSFRDAAGAVLSELIFFVEVFRDVPELRIEPVWIFLGKPNRDLIASLTVTAHLPLEAQRCRYGFAEDRGPGFWDEIQRFRKDACEGDGPRWPEARLVQTGSSFYRIEKRTCPDASWLKATEGRRSQGWCHVTDGQVAVTGAMRYLWQEYPRSLALDCDRGTLTFGLVPVEGPPLDLRRYSPTVHGKVVYESGSGPFDADLHGPYGMAKAHELMLRFHDPSDPDSEPAQRGLFFVHPCRPMAEPVHFARSRVVGRVAAAAPPADAGVEAALASIADFMVAERDVRGWYGLLDYGDIQIAFYGDLDRWGFDDGGFAWINTESLPDYGLWLSALRAARADWLEAAIAMSRHNRDVDAYHRGPLRGLGSRHNVNHWGCRDKEWRISMPLVRRLHYYATADPWTAECIRETVAVYQSHERTASIAPSMTSAASGILAKWEMSGDPADGAALRQLADAFAAAVRPDGQFTAKLHADLATGEGRPEGDAPHSSPFFMNTFGGQHVLVEMAELLDHAELSAALVRHADFWLREGAAARDVIVFLSHAACATGEDRFLEAASKAIREFSIEFAEAGGDGALDRPRHRVLPGMTRRNKVACHTLGDPLHLLPYGLAVMAAKGGAP